MPAAGQSAFAGQGHLESHPPPVFISPPALPAQLPDKRQLRAGPALNSGANMPHCSPPPAEDPCPHRRGDVIRLSLPGNSRSCPRTGCCCRICSSRKMSPLAQGFRFRWLCAGARHWRCLSPSTPTAAFCRVHFGPAEPPPHRGCTCGGVGSRKGQDGLKPTHDKGSKAITNDRHDSGTFLELWDEFQPHGLQLNLGLPGALQNPLPMALTNAKYPREQHLQLRALKTGGFISAQCRLVEIPTAKRCRSFQNRATDHFSRRIKGRRGQLMGPRETEATAR